MTPLRGSGLADGEWWCAKPDRSGGESAYPQHRCNSLSSARSGIPLARSASTVRRT